jgi:hypothetical protein
MPSPRFHRFPVTGADTLTEVARGPLTDAIFAAGVLRPTIGEDVRSRFLLVEGHPMWKGGPTVWGAAEGPLSTRSGQSEGA